MAIASLNKTEMEVLLQSNGLISGTAQLVGVDGVTSCWFGGDSDPSQFVKLMLEIESGAIENIPTKIIYKFFYETNGKQALLELENFDKIPQALREIAGINL